MNEETLIKYLEFLKDECVRHQNDKFISEDEINQLNIEIKRFVKKLKASNNTSNTKKIVLNIDFDLSDENHNRKKLSWLSLFGSYFGKEIKEQENRKHRFSRLYNNLDAALFQIKSI